jgi:hypothetical protein
VHHLSGLLPLVTRLLGLGQYRRISSIYQYIFIYLFMAPRAKTSGRDAALRSYKLSSVLRRYPRGLTGALRRFGRGERRTR